MDKHKNRAEFKDGRQKSEKVKFGQMLFKFKTQFICRKN